MPNQPPVKGKPPIAETVAGIRRVMKYVRELDTAMYDAIETQESEYLVERRRQFIDDAGVKAAMAIVLRSATTLGVAIAPWIKFAGSAWAANHADDFDLFLKEVLLSNEIRRLEPADKPRDLIPHREAVAMIPGTLAIDARQQSKLMAKIRAAGVFHEKRGTEYWYDRAEMTLAAAGARATSRRQNEDEPDDEQEIEERKETERAKKRLR